MEDPILPTISAFRSVSCSIKYYLIYVSIVDSDVFKLPTVIVFVEVPPRPGKEQPLNRSTIAAIRLMKNLGFRDRIMSNPPLVKLHPIFECLLVLISFRVYLRSNPLVRLKW